VRERRVRRERTGSGNDCNVKFRFRAFVPFPKLVGDEKKRKNSGANVLAASIRLKGVVEK